MSKTESERTRELCRALEHRGAITYANVQGTMTIQGRPDRWLCHPLWTGHLEFKSWDGKLTDYQRLALKRIHQLQEYTALCVRHGHDGPNPMDGSFGRWSQVELWDGTILAEYDCSVEHGAIGLLLALDHIKTSKVVTGMTRYEQNQVIREVLKRAGGKQLFVARNDASRA